MKRLLVGTRKGLLVYRQNGQGWAIESDHFMGIPVAMVFPDDRNGSWWVALDHGHWGIKLHRSKDEGATWEELKAPEYPEGTYMKEDVPASLRYIWAFAKVRDEGDEIYIGTEPGGLFRLDGDGNYQFLSGLWNVPHRMTQWFGGGRDYPGLHSVVVDPRDSNHVYAGISVGGVYESLDAGITWQPKNKGLRADFLPDPHAEIGHDPHLLVACASAPDVLWQQNHCGIFRSVDGSETWQDVSDPDGPANFGFAVAVDQRDPARAWVAPGVSDEIRVAVDKSLCIARTADGGKSWQYLRNGLPQAYCYDIVYRHALVASGEDVAFGTTTGNLFVSADAGDHWTALSHHLAMVYCLAFEDRG